MNWITSKQTLCFHSGHGKIVHCNQRTVAPYRRGEGDQSGEPETRKMTWDRDQLSISSQRRFNKVFAYKSKQFQMRVGGWSHHYIRC